MIDYRTGMREELKQVENEKMMNLLGRLDLSYRGDKEIYHFMMENENGQEQTETEQENELS